LAGFGQLLDAGSAARCPPERDRRNDFPGDGTGFVTVVRGRSVDTVDTSRLGRRRSLGGSAPVAAVAQAALRRRCTRR
jgi:hypothetical protein